MAEKLCDVKGTGSNKMIVPYIGIRSYSGNTTTSLAEFRFDLEGKSTVKVGSRDSGLSQATCDFWNGSGTRIETNDIPTSGATYSIPSGAAYVRFQAVVNSATGSTNVYKINNIEIS